MDYIKIVEDLNSDIFEEFTDNPIKNNFKYSYHTDGDTESIQFYGVEIFNTEDYNVEHSNSVDEMTFTEFEDYLEEQVAQIGKKFLQYSFYNEIRESIVNGGEDSFW